MSYQAAAPVTSVQGRVGTVDLSTIFGRLGSGNGWGATNTFQRVGFFGSAAPAAQPIAGQTSAAVAVTAATSVAPFGYTTAAQADGIRIAVNQLVADVAAIRAALQSVGLLQ